MYDVNDIEKVYVITYKELLFTIAVFIVILISLYPKGVLKNQIALDETNHELSIIYLNKLLEHSPDDEELKFLLFQKKAAVGDFEVASTLADDLMVSSSQELYETMLPLAYKFRKDQYFALDNENNTSVAQEGKELFKKLTVLMHNIFTYKLYDDNSSKWYQEAMFTNNRQAAYYFLKIEVEKDPTNLELLRNGFYLSSEFKDNVNKERFVNALVEYDKDNSELWVEQKYILLVQKRDYTGAKKLLEKYQEKSYRLKKKLAEFYHMNREYKLASKLYLELYELTLEEKERDKYLKKSIEVLQSGNLLNSAADLVRKYELDYIGDVEMRKFFIKIYLASNKLNYAAAYVKKILEYEK